MKYVSLDLETTCVTPDPEHILMVSMVVEDTDKPETVLEDLPHFTAYIKQQEPISGNFFALAMNSWILDILAKRNKNPKYPILSGYDWGWHALKFLREHFPTEKRITVAGKNVAGFDVQFLPPELKTMFKHKTLDPGTLYVDWTQDTEVPNLDLCKQRASINTPTAHDAREDAFDVIRLFRFKQRSNY